MLEDLFWAPFRTTASISVAILVLAGVVILILILQRERNVYDWNRGCTCDRGPWGRTLHIDCSIHGRPGHNRRRGPPARTD